MVEPQADQPLHHRHRGRVPLDRRRRHAVRLHGQGGAPDRIPAPRSVAADRPGSRVLAADRLLLIMPTWRRELVGERDTAGRRRAVQRPASGTRRSPSPGSSCSSPSACASSPTAPGSRIAFVPHPNMSAFLDEVVPLPRRGLPVRRCRHPGALRPRRGDRHRLLVERVRARLPRPPGRLLPVRPRPVLLRPARLPPGRVELRARRFRTCRRRARRRSSTSSNDLVEHGMTPSSRMPRAWRRPSRSATASRVSGCSSRSC